MRPFVNIRHAPLPVAMLARLLGVPAQVVDMDWRRGIRTELHVRRWRGRIYILWFKREPIPQEGEG